VGEDAAPARPRAASAPERAQATADTRTVPLIPVRQGQLDYEAELLTFKLRLRAPKLVSRLEADLRNARLEIHPLFTTVPGGIEPWEKVRDDL
jgi:hypothetical protein